jgi:hypothetical protein
MKAEEAFPFDPTVRISRIMPHQYDLVPAYGMAATGFTAKPLSSFASRSQDGDSDPDTADPSTISLPEIASYASSADSHEELKTPPMHCQELVQGECIITPI